MEAVDVIQPSIPGLRHDRQRPPVALHIGMPMFHFPCNHGIANDAHAMRVGDHYRSIEKAGVFHPRCAGHLAVAVFREPRCEDSASRPFSPGQHCRNSGTHRPLAHFQRTLARNQSRMPDLNAFYIRDRIKGTRDAVKWNSQITGTRLGPRRNEDCKKQNGNPCSKMKFQHQSPPE